MKVRKTIEVEVTHGDYITAAHEKLNRYIGPCGKTPQSITRRFVDLGRQMGKTETMLENLPNRQLILVTHKLDFGRELLKVLKFKRPEFDTEQIILVSYLQLKEVGFDRRQLRVLKGIKDNESIPMFFDNAVLDIIQMDFVDDLNQGVR